MNDDFAQVPWPIATPDRALRWATLLGLPPHLWLGPDLDPLPEPLASADAAPAPHEPNATLPPQPEAIIQEIQPANAATAREIVALLSR